MAERLDLDNMTREEQDAYTVELDRRRSLLPLLDLSALAQVQPEPRNFALTSFIPHGEVTLFTGPGGVNKSLYGQQLCSCISAGLPFLGLDAMRGASIFITAEDDERELHWRQHHIAKRLDIRFDQPGLHLSSLRGLLGNELCIFDAEGRLKPSASFKLLVDTINATGAVFVVLDNVAHLFAGNENDRGQVTQFANLLNRLAGETSATILLIGHPNKSGDSYSGSTAWLNAFRSHIVMDWQRDGEGNIPDGDAREVRLGKANYARTGESLSVRWHDFTLIRDDELSADYRERLAATIEANRANDAFLRCLAAATANKRSVSHSPSVNYFGRVFPQMTEARGIKQKAFEQAFERLLHLGEIELDARLWRGEDRHWKTGIRVRETARETLRETGAGNCGEPLAGNCGGNTPTPYGCKGARPVGAAAPPLDEPDDDPFDRPDPFAGFVQ
jgi:RecA-family ATPase